MDLMGADDTAVARIEEALASSQMLKGRRDQPTISLQEEKALQQVVDLIVPMLEGDSTDELPRDHSGSNEADMVMLDELNFGE